jgi:putative acetyltransferase
MNKPEQSPVIVRGETPTDHRGITLINDLAFGQKQEGILVEKLRKKALFDPRLSLVAMEGDHMVGHILFFPVTIDSEDNSAETLSLGPMSVHPDFQRSGIGKMLVRSGLDVAKRLGYRSVVVLGHPEYYPKFGFIKASLYNIKDPFDAPGEAMMAIELDAGSLGFGGGVISYPPEFYDTI